VGDIDTADGAVVEGTLKFKLAECLLQETGDEIVLLEEGDYSQ
jgi:hypothetical protein